MAKSPFKRKEEELDHCLGSRVSYAEPVDEYGEEEGVRYGEDDGAR